MINITIESLFEHYSRFNVIAMCGGFNALGEQQYVVSAKKAEGESLTELSAEDAHHLEIILYFIPVALPSGKNIAIDEFPPFPAEVIVKRDDTDIYRQMHQINAWGGSAVRLNLEL